jgi:putative membrane protein
MSDTKQYREPEAFALDDPRVDIEIEAPDEAALALPPGGGRPRRERNWLGIFLSAVGGLLALAALLWVQDTIMALLKRSDWLGWAATGLFALAALALFMIIAREVTGLMRLSALAATRTAAELALAKDDAKQAMKAASALRESFKGRADLAATLRNLKAHDRDILSAKQVLSLHERELLLDLDVAAKTAIGGAARRVSAVTSVSPAPIAVAYVAYENFKLLRALAGVYGGRPGFMSVLRLVRLIGGHLALTSGIAFTDDFLHQFIGHGLTARLSRRLGEGLINGAFTIRIGLATLEVVRPLPYIETAQPRLREFVTEFLRVRRKPSPQASE